MIELRRLFGWEGLLFLLGLYGMTAIQLLTGAINTKGLLYGRSRGNKIKFSPERAQLLVFTIGAASYYLLQAVAAMKMGHLPPVPETWPTLIGTSNALYLGGKAYSRFLSRNGNEVHRRMK